MATYEIVCSKGYDRNTAAAMKSFLTVAAGQAQRSLSDIGYVPLPPRLQMRVQAAIDAIE